MKWHSPKIAMRLPLWGFMRLTTKFMEYYCDSVTVWVFTNAIKPVHNWLPIDVFPFPCFILYSIQYVHTWILHDESTNTYCDLILYFHFV